MKMKWIVKPAALLGVSLFSFFFYLALTVVASAQKPNVIPNLQQWTDAAGGGQFTLTSVSRIVYQDSSLGDTAALLQGELKELNQLQLPVLNTGASQPGDIVLRLASGGTPTIGAEGYVLTIGGTVDIQGSDAPGVFYGTRTILQILKQDGEKRVSLPKGTATDAPAYKERGLMLDTARKFFTVDFLENYIKQMAWLKLNVLHLHFTDDQGFRLESNVPGLTSPQHYTKDEIRALVAFAKRYYVTIIPEIDFPAHATTLTKARPDLLHACPNMAGTGDLDLTDPNTMPFVQSLIDEYLPLFEADSFHIGADEYTYFAKSREKQLTSLKSCPEIVAKAAEIGYSDPGDLYRNFINETNEYIKSKGKKTRIWEWFDYVGSMPVSNDIVYDAWLGENNIQDKSDAGFDIINSTYHYLYIIPGRSVPDKKYLYESWQPWIWSSAPNGRLANPNDPRLIGAKLHVWNDGLFTPFVPEAAIDNEIITTLKVFAERIWGSPKRASYAAFLADAGKIGNVPGYGFGLIGDYRFDAITGNEAPDASGTGNTGTLYGPVSVAGMFGSGGLSFRGGSDRIHIGQPDVEGEWTASFWVKREASGAAAAKLLDSPKASLRLEQLNTNGKVGITKYGSGDYSFNYTAPAGQWVHLAFVGKPSGTSLYVNGELKETIGQSIALPLKTIGSNQLSFKGSLDEVKLFNKALDETGIQSIYQGLVASYGLEETNNVEVTDRSGLGNGGGFKGPVRADGWRGRGLQFGGGDDFIYTSLPDIPDHWTASMWVKRESTDQSAEVLMSSPVSSLRVKQILSGKVGFTLNGVNDYSFQYALPADGTWKHLTFVGDSQGTSLYVNGVFNETHPAKISLPMQAIGKVSSSLKGTVDEIKLFDRSLTAEQIRQLYGAAPAVPNVALNKTVTAATYEAGRGPELAVDADASNNSYWDAPLGNNPGRWLQVDLQGVFAVEGINVRNYVDGSRYYHYTVETSADGVNWTTIASKTDSSPAADSGDYYPVQVQARYVRVTMTHNSANNSVHISDLKVYGRGVKDERLPNGARR